MNTSRAAINREVRRFMRAERLTQTDMAARLNISQAQLSRRLSGIAGWSDDDLDTLFDLGVEVALPALAGSGGEDE